MVFKGSFTFTLFLLLGLCTGNASGQPDSVYERFALADGSLPQSWHAGSGKWQVADGKLQVDSMSGDAFIFFGNNLWQNYILQVDVTFKKVTNQSRWCSLIFRADSSGQKPFSQFPLRFKSTLNNGAEFAVRRKDSWDVRRSAKATSDSIIGKTRKLKVIVRASQVTGFVDGQPVIRSSFCIDRDTGCVGLGASGCIVAFDNFRLTHLEDTSMGSYARRNRPCEIISHRGFSQAAPENTLASIKESILIGAEACEFDLRSTRDGRAVLLHDATVNRTTNGKGNIADMMFAQIKDLDAGSWKDVTYTGEAIPTLAEALTAMKLSSQKAVIDVKDKSAVKDLMRFAKDYSMLDKIIVLSPDKTVFDEVMAINRQVQRAWLCYDFPKNMSTPADQIKWVTDQAMRFDTQIVDMDYRLVSPELVRQLHLKNIKVWVWTVNNEAIMDCLIDWGVDGITTDRPKTLKVVRDTKRIDPLENSQTELAEAISP